MESAPTIKDPINIIREECRIMGIRADDMAVDHLHIYDNVVDYYELPYEIVELYYEIITKLENFELSEYEANDQLIISLRSLLEEHIAKQKAAGLENYGHKIDPFFHGPLATLFAVNEKLRKEKTN
jgi:hypothetical protein